MGVTLVTHSYLYKINQIILLNSGLYIHCMEWFYIYIYHKLGNFIDIIDIFNICENERMFMGESMNDSIYRYIVM